MLRLTPIAFARKGFRFVLLLCMVISMSMSYAFAQSKTPITMWLHEATPEVGAWAMEFEKKFNEENPDIDLTISLSGGLRRDQLVVTTAAGVAPDIFTESANVMGMYVLNGIAAPINRFLDKSEAAGDLLPAVMDDLRFGGQVYALPVNLYPIFDVYNMDYFHAGGVAEPADWDEMVGAARKLTRYSNDGRVEVYGYHTETGNPTIGVQLHTKMVQLGGELIGPDDTQIEFDYDIAVRAAEYLHDLWEAGMPGLLGSGGRGRSGLNEVVNGKVAIQNKMSGRHFGTAPEIIYEIGFRRYTGPTSDTAAVQYNGAVIAMTDSTPHPEETWRVMEAFIAPENSREYLLAYQGVLPVRASLMSDRELLAAFPRADELMALLAPPLIPNGAMNAYFPDTIREMVGQQLRRMFTEGIGAQNALQEAERLVNARLGQE